MLGLIAYRAMQRLWDNHALYRSGMRPRLLLARMADNTGIHSQKSSASIHSSGKYMRWVAFHVVLDDPGMAAGWKRRSCASSGPMEVPKYATIRNVESRHGAELMLISSMS